MKLVSKELVEHEGVVMVKTVHERGDGTQFSGFSAMFEHYGFSYRPPAIQAQPLSEEERSAASKARFDAKFFRLDQEDNKYIFDSQGIPLDWTKEFNLFGRIPNLNNYVVFGHLGEQEAIMKKLEELKA